MSPRPPVAAEFRFLLYVADDTQNSGVAVANLKALCESHLPGRHEIEIVDVFKQPERALADHIYLTPTLIRLAPSPVRRIVGTLSQGERVLHALGLEPIAV
jgi:circadian clock protein KaiB